MIEPPYGEIADELKAGKVIPFLGAGVNFGGKPRCVEWNLPCPYPPSGAELSRFLARKANFPEEEGDADDLSKVASFFAETARRQRLRERLKQIFDRDFDPCEVHSYLAQIETNMLIVTTNYDDLTERSFIKAGRPFDLVIHPTDRKDVAASVLWRKHGAQEFTPVATQRLGDHIDLETTTVLYKMHGTVDRRRDKLGSYVITEEDYVDFLCRMTSQSAVPALLMEHFETRSFLFLGYGLRDWNLRVVLKSLKKVLPRPEQSTPEAESTSLKRPERILTDEEEANEETASWAIQFHPSELERELWRARGVKIFDVDIVTFIRGLRAAAM